MTGAIAKAKEMEQEGYVYIDQFRNHANPEAHMKTTAEEILRDFPKLDYLVLGVGTGGTLTGLARIIRKRYPNLKIIAVEPFRIERFASLPKGPHKIQEIGAGFVPPLLETKEVDRIISIASADAMNKAKLLARQGLFLGISSAAAILASEIVADQVKNAVIMTVVPMAGQIHLDRRL
jgi:cysteine synthase A